LFPDLLESVIPECF